ncbi:restriction endonuclease subunit S [uncultured Thiodictyon sp.]|uniref:restriction endonuclease subunit S n=1 Tax=uncultured Thiodictyon sp. TaxID=1846217 RepID=UPI0025EC508F|nr:restriction endonuclease subunit S [uncultured Thiodictyon sp.]
MSFPRYPSYKDSSVEWLGDVPAHWKVKRLRFVALLNPSKAEIAGLDRDTDVSFLPMEAVGDDGSIKLDRIRPIREVETGYTYFQNGDVTVAKITPCFENGKGAAMRGLQSGIGFGTTELIVARPITTAVTSDYLGWLFRSTQFRKRGEASMYGAGGQKRVPDDFVRDFAVACPDPDEQTIIAIFLDHEIAKIDAPMTEQRTLIELLKEKRQAVISHAVTKGLNPNASMKDSGVEWLGKAPEHWGVKPLKYLVNFQSGGTPRKENLDYWDGDIPWASAKDLKAEVLGDTIDHITENAVQSGSAELMSAGSVLVVVRGMILARTFPVAVAAVPMAINQDLKALECHDMVEHRFLARLLQASSEESRRRIDEAGHGTNALRMEAWTSMGLRVLPLKEQLAIVDYIEEETAKLDALTLEAQQAISLLQERRTALISAAVTGKIDVRGLALYAAERPDEPEKKSDHAKAPSSPRFFNRRSAFGDSPGG